MTRTMNTGLEGKIIEEPETWFSIGKSVGQFVGGAIIALYGLSRASKHILPKLASKVLRKNYLSYFENFHEIARDMDGIRSATGAHRVVIFNGHNCGGNPDISKPYFVSAMHWSLDESHKGHFPDGGYKDIRVDGTYVNLLLQMTMEGSVWVNPKIIPESLIRRIYMAEGIVDSVWFYITSTDTNYHFVSIANYERLFTDYEKTKMQIAVDGMKGKFK